MPINTKEEYSNGGSTVVFNNNTRYLILVITLICLSLVFSNSLALNFTIICMDKDAAIEQEFLLMEDEPITNISTTYSLFSQAERGALFSATAVGMLLGAIPITMLTTHFGMRIMLTSYFMLSAVCTLLTPLAGSFGFLPLFAMRVGQGAAVSTSFVAMAGVSSEWSTQKSSGFYLALLSCHLQAGPIFTMPLAGELCESRWGWPALYYLLGGISVFFFSLFFYFFRDSPRFQRHVSDKELKRIERGKVSSQMSREEKSNVPYREISKDPVIWGILIGTLGGILGYQVFVQYGPIYLNKALGMDVEKTGLAVALPYLLSFISKMVAGALSDKVTCLTDRGRVIFFASISQFAMAGCYALLFVLPASYQLCIQLTFTMAVVFSGLNCVGMVKATQLAAQHHAHVIHACNTFLSSIIVLLLPVGIGLVAPNNTQEEWGWVFVIITAIVVVGTTIFNFTIDVEPRKWTLTAPVAKPSKKQQLLNLQMANEQHLKDVAGELEKKLVKEEGEKEEKGIEVKFSAV